METAEIEQEFERPANSKLGQPGDIANNQLCAWRFPLGNVYRPRNVIDTGHLPAVVEQIPAVRGGPTAEVDGVSGRQRVWTLDELD